MRAGATTCRGGAIAGRIIGAGVTTRRGGPIAGRIIGVWNPLWNGATGPNKGAAPGGRLHRRAAHRKNGEDADRNSNGHRTRSACVVNGPPTLFRLVCREKSIVRGDGDRVMSGTPVATGSPLAAMNKCLAQRNKTRRGPEATNKRPAARRNCVRG